MQKAQILKKIFVGLIFLYTIFFLTLETVGDRWIVSILDEQIKQYPGYTIRIDSISHRLLDPLNIKIKGFYIDHQSTNKLSIREISPHIAYSGILHKHIQIEKLHFDVSSVVIDSTDLDRFSQHPTPSTKPAKTNDSEIKISLEEGALQISKGQLDDMFFEDLSIVTSQFHVLFDDNPIKRAKADISIALKKFQHPYVEMKDCKSGVSVHGGKVSVEDFHCSVFEEDLHLSLDALISPKLKNINSAFQLSSFDLARMSTYLGEDFSYPMKGKIKIKGSIVLPSVEQFLDASGAVDVVSEHIEIQNINANTLMEAYLDSNKASLLDVAGFMTLGPIGVLASQSAKMSQTIPGVMGGKTNIKNLKVQIQIDKGRAVLEDVAFATDKFRVAAKGALQLQNKTFDGLKIGFLNKKGCADLVQKIGGTFEKPEFGVSKSVLKTVVAPVTSVGKKIGNLVTGGCKVFYDGSVEHPVNERKN